MPLDSEVPIHFSLGCVCRARPMTDTYRCEAQPGAPVCYVSAHHQVHEQLRARDFQSRRSCSLCFAPLRGRKCSTDDRTGVRDRSCES